MHLDFFNKYTNKHRVFNVYIPFILSITIALNGLASIMVAMIPIIDHALYRDLAEYSNLFALESSFKVDTTVSLVIGYAFLLVARGIYLRKRVQWVLSIIMLIALIYFNLSSEIANTKLVYFYVLEIVLLGISYQVFNQKMKPIQLNYSQIIVFITFIFFLCYGVIGTYILKDEFSGVKTWTDALYFTTVTFSTVGYGDVVPMTESARAFVISMIFFGVGTFAAMITVLAGAIIDNIMNKLRKGRQSMKHHTIICGYNSLGKFLINNYFSGRKDYLIIDKDDLSADDEIRDNFLRGYSGDEATLKQADILDALKVIIANDSDADNILTLITIKQIMKEEEAHKQPHLVVRISDENNVTKAKALGADTVVTPNALAAKLMMS